MSVTPATCRLATDDDVPSLAALRRRWAEEDAGEPLDDAGYDAAFASWWASESAHRRHWLATVDGDAVGMASIVVMTRMPQPGHQRPPWGYVHHVYVTPEHRNGGVGAALVGHVVAACRSDGFQRLVLHPRPRSVPFYERLGFTAADDLVSLGL